MSDDLLGGLWNALRGPEAVPAAPLPAPLPAPPQTPSEGPDVPDEAVGLVKEFEGFSAKPYQDPVGVWTIGYGSTRAYGQPVTATYPAQVTEGEACDLVKADLMAAAVQCNLTVKVSLSAPQMAAIEDFIYNLGATNFRSSTLLKKLNAGDYAGAAAEFDKWDQAGGKVLAGLLRRRQAETTLFKTPSTGSNT